MYSGCPEDRPEVFTPDDFSWTPGFTPDDFLFTPEPPPFFTPDVFFLLRTRFWTFSIVFITNGFGLRTFWSGLQTILV